VSGSDGNSVVVGTRGSRLALWQADFVAGRLAALRPGIEIRRTIIKTIGDRILDTPLSKIGDKGLFTKELEAALLDGRIDIAVHSLKDLPTRLPAGLAIGAILEREDPRDALVSLSRTTLRDLPSGARVGTSSLRRRSQILALRSDLVIVDLRGNVPTRIERVEKGEMDAVVLAKAGVVRLGLGSKIVEVIDPDTILSAVGQGAIAIEIRANDPRIPEILAPLDHFPTRLAVIAERALLRRLEGGCQIPIGALGTLERENLTLRGLVADLEGHSIIRATDSVDLLRAAAGVLAEFQGARRPPDEPGVSGAAAAAGGDGRPGDWRTLLGVHPDATARETRAILTVMEEAAAALGDRLAHRLLDMGARPILEAIISQARPGHESSGPADPGALGSSADNDNKGKD
jgi:hydroxymethylbilane synthase